MATFGSGEPTEDAVQKRNAFLDNFLEAKSLDATAVAIARLAWECGYDEGLTTAEEEHDDSTEAHPHWHSMTPEQQDHAIRMAY